MIDDPWFIHQVPFGVDDGFHYPRWQNGNLLARTLKQRLQWELKITFN